MKNVRFLLIFDAMLCIPNGDPYTRLPRQISDNRGILSAQSIKYKIKRRLHDMGYQTLHYTETNETVKEKIGYSSVNDEKDLQKKALEYIDVRLFGACDLAGEIRIVAKAPVTMSLPVTYDSTRIIDVALNKNYILGVEEPRKEPSTFQNAHEILEYGLFYCYGGIDAKEAEKMNLSEEDVEAFFEALKTLFEGDASDARPIGSMNIRHIYRWDYERRKIYSDLELLNSIIVNKKEGVSLPTKYEDYTIKENRVEDLNTQIII